MTIRGSPTPLRGCLARREEEGKGDMSLYAGRERSLFGKGGTNLTQFDINSTLSPLRTRYSFLPHSLLSNNGEHPAIFQSLSLLRFTFFSFNLIALVKKANDRVGPSPATPAAVPSGPPPPPTPVTPVFAAPPPSPAKADIIEGKRLLRESKMGSGTKHVFDCLP